MHIITNQQYFEAAIKKEALKRHVENLLLSYFETKAYPKDIVAEIVNKEFITSNPSYYLFYPYLFNDYFEVSDKKVLDLLSISGFLYYRYVILIDDIFDNKTNQTAFQKFFVANICQEETVKILIPFSIKIPISGVHGISENLNTQEHTS